jgi:hypothetical protein
MGIYKSLAAFALLLSCAAHAQTVPNCPTTFYIMGHTTTLWVPCFYLVQKPGVPISLPAAAVPDWGTTPAQILALYPYNQLLNFARNQNLDAMVTSMDNSMIAHLSTLLAAHDVSNYTYSIMAYAGERLSAANLHRLEAAFGPALFATALAYSPASTRAAYNATPMIAPLLLSAYWAQSNPAAPPIGDAWAYALLLNEVTASAGESSMSAFAAVARYVQEKINNVALVGISLGAAFLAVYNNPQMQIYLNQLAAWWVAEGQAALAASWSTGGFSPERTSAGMIITINPSLAPPPIDPGAVPQLPPIEGDALIVCFFIFEDEGC